MEEVENWGSFMNGPKAGHTIKLPNPVPKEYSMSVGVITCQHRPETNIPMLTIKYKVNQSAGIPNQYFLISDTDINDIGYHCIQCREEAKIKFRLEKIKDILNEDEEDDE